MIALFGADSIAGEEILALFRKTREITPVDSAFDICSRDMLGRRIDEIKPEIIINCHEFGDMVKAEYERELVYNINGFAVRDMAEICRDRGIYLIHISSSYVFDGSGNVPYKEEDNAKPISAFGDSKLLGENFIMESRCRSLIVRLPDLYSYRDSFLQKIISRIKKYRSINLVKGQYLSPVSAPDAAAGIGELAARGADGVFHYCSSGMVTARDFIESALRIYRERSGETDPWNLNERDYREFSIVADRPLFNVLDKSKYEKYTGKNIRDWKTSLEEYFTSYGDRL